MGTNYYLRLHLGKISGGPGGQLRWTWDVNGPVNDSELRRLIRRRADAEIVDEYDREMGVEDFLALERRAVQIEHSRVTFS